MRGEDTSKDWHRVPNSAAPIIWEEGMTKAEDRSFKGVRGRDEDPYKGVGIEDLEAAREDSKRWHAERGLK